MTAATWKSKCLRAADAIGVELEFYDEGDSDDAFEDDEALHVTRCGVRAVFCVGADMSARVQNERTRKIMESLKIKVQDESRILADESHDPVICPHCGGDL